MNVIHVNEKNIFGLVERTNNKSEMNPQTGKIASLVERFDASVSVNYRNGARVFTVYSEYETDASGDYSVLVGTDKVESSRVELESVKIQEGNYLVFSAQGQIPNIVFDTWFEIWSYFENKNCPHIRGYTTDFEFYKSQNEIEIHIAIQ